jgi:hypothetical protein
MLQTDKEPQIDEAIWRAWVEKNKAAGQIQVCKTLESDGCRGGVSYGERGVVEIHKLSAGSPTIFQWGSAALARLAFGVSCDFQKFISD